MGNRIITALDIGTKSIKALAVSENRKSGEFEVLAKMCLSNFGMRRGVIEDPEKVSRKISEVLEKIQEKLGKKINKVIVNIGGSHIFLTSSKASVVISRFDNSISQEDVERSIQEARSLSLPANTEIIHFFEKGHVVDEGESVKDPVGMKGRKLESEVCSIGVFSPYYRNLNEACINADIDEVSEVICSPVASAEACLTDQQKELGVVLLDIGAGTTDLAIYKEGDLCHLKVIPIGSEHITDDIAVALRTDINIAEEIKKEFGHCLKSKSGKSLKKKEKDEKEIPANCLNFSSKILTKAIKARLSDIFDIAKEEIKKSSVESLPGGVVITGGGAKMSGIVELAKKELKLPCKIGIPVFKKDGFGEEFTGQIEEDPCFSTAWGLTIAGFDDFSEEKKGNPIIDRIKKILKVFVP